MPLMLAWWFQKREGQLRPLDFAVAGLLLLVPVGLVMKQPDLGTALLILSTGIYVIFFAGLSWRLIVPVMLLAAVAVVALVVSRSPRSARTAWPGMCCVTTRSTGCAPCWTRPPTRWARASTSSRA